MTLNEFKKQAVGQGTEVQVLVNEGDLYLIRLVEQDSTHLLMDGDHALRLKSLAECVDLLSTAGVISGFIVQQSPYDEMISGGSSGGEHKMPLHIH